MERMKMNIHNVKIELVLPVFLGCLGALFFCAMIPALGSLGNCFGKPNDPAPVQEEISAPRDLLFFARAEDEGRDYIKEMYLEPELQKWVIDFFVDVCSSQEIAEVILVNAGAFDIPPALAFALSWEESRFNPNAVNRKNRDGSIDRGLFQLNNRSFPQLETQAFFDPKVSAWYGMGHLRHCLDTGGTEIAALAMYNAGTGKVRTTGAPKITLDYINRILENRRKIEIRFQNRLRHEAETRIAGRSPGTGADEHIDLLREEFAEKVSSAQGQPRFMRLTPLRGQKSFTPSL
jgi:hypothetical protein